MAPAGNTMEYQYSYQRNIPLGDKSRDRRTGGMALVYHRLGNRRLLWIFPLNFSKLQSFPTPNSETRWTPIKEKPVCKQPNGGDLSTFQRMLLSAFDYRNFPKGKRVSSLTSFYFVWYYIIWYFVEFCVFSCSESGLLLTFIKLCTQAAKQDDLCTVQPQCENVLWVLLFQQQLDFQKNNIYKVYWEGLLARWHS